MEIPELMAYCGLRCDSCPIYLATRETDPQEQARKKVGIAELAREHYKMDLKLEDITDCDGCRTSTGRLFSGCRKCEIRKCAREREYPTCAHCPEYPCDKLQKFFATDPDARRSLEDIRSSL